MLEPGVPLLTLAPRELALSALKPAESGAGMVVRVLNPSDSPLDAVLTFGVPVHDAVSVRLDEEPDGLPVGLVDGTVRLPVGPHALRSVRLT
jgi:alpha-mannosidase